MNIFAIVLDDNKAILTWSDSTMIMKKDDAIDILKNFLNDMPFHSCNYIQ